MDADVVVVGAGLAGLVAAAPVFRCDPSEFPTRLTLAARLGEGWTGSLRLPDRTLCLDRVRVLAASQHVRTP